MATEARCTPGQDVRSADLGCVYLHIIFEGLGEDKLGEGEHQSSAEILHEYKHGVSERNVLFREMVLNCYKWLASMIWLAGFWVRLELAGRGP